MKKIKLCDSWYSTLQKQKMKTLSKCLSWYVTTQKTLDLFLSQLSLTLHSSQILFTNLRTTENTEDDLQNDWSDQRCIQHTFKHSCWQFWQGGQLGYETQTLGSIFHPSK